MAKGDIILGSGGKMCLTTAGKVILTKSEFYLAVDGIVFPMWKSSLPSEQGMCDCTRTYSIPYRDSPTPEGPYTQTWSVGTTGYSKCVGSLNGTSGVLGGQFSGEDDRDFESIVISDPLGTDSLSMVNLKSACDASTSVSVLPVGFTSMTLKDPNGVSRANGKLTVPGIYRLEFYPVFRISFAVKYDFFGNFTRLSNHDFVRAYAPGGLIENVTGTYDDILHAVVLQNDRTSYYNGKSVAEIFITDNMTVGSVSWKNLMHEVSTSGAVGVSASYVFSSGISNPITYPIGNTSGDLISCQTKKCYFDGTVSFPVTFSTSEV